MFDNDRLTKVTPLCQKKVYVKHLKNLTTDGAVFMNLDMENSVKNMGTLLFGIRYLPTSQRFNVNIIKAEKLKYDSRVPSLLEFSKFCDALLKSRRHTCSFKSRNAILLQIHTFELSWSTVMENALRKKRRHLNKENSIRFLINLLFSMCPLQI